MLDGQSDHRNKVLTSCLVSLKEKDLHSISKRLVFIGAVYYVWLEMAGIICPPYYVPIFCPGSPCAANVHN